MEAGGGTGAHALADAARPDPPRLGLVLSGGSCRCAFQAGVIEGLTARGLRFDVVGAVSSGVWNATAVATGQVGDLAELWREAAHHPTYSFRNLAFNRTPWNYLWLHHHFSRHFLAWDRLPVSATLWLVGVTRLRDLAPVVFSNRDGLDPFQLALASNTLPPIYPWPARLGDRLYVDGGFSDNLIYEAVLARGCARVVLVTLTPDGALWKSIRDRRHRLPLALRDRIVVVHPEEPLEIGFNDLDPGRVRRAIEAGRRAADRVLLPPGLGRLDVAATAL